MKTNQTSVKFGRPALRITLLCWATLHCISFPCHGQAERQPAPSVPLRGQSMFEWLQARDAYWRAAPGAPAAAVVPVEMTPRELVAAVEHSIVRIETIYTVTEEVEVAESRLEELAKGNMTVRTMVENTYTFTGTGFIVPGGFIVTNNHVVTAELKPGQTMKGSVSYRATLAFDTRPPEGILPDGRRAPFPQLKMPDDHSPDPGEFVRDMVKLELVNRDSQSDLAVLRLLADLESGSSRLPSDSLLFHLRPPSDRHLLMLEGPLTGRLSHVAKRMEAYAVKFAPADEVKVGADVIAFGFPGTIAGSPTVTRGIVSGLNRELPGGIATDLIQTDAAINPGNSGGPLFDMFGRVVGVNTFSLNHAGAPGIGFARSSRTAEPFVRQLVKGPIRRANLGIEAVPLDPETTDLLGVAPGLLIIAVAENSIAENAGLRPLDLLVQIGSERVTRVGDFANALAIVGDANSTVLTVWRLPDAALKSLGEGEEGIQSLRMSRLFSPDGAIRLDSIEKLSFRVLLKFAWGSSRPPLSPWLSTPTKKE